MSIRSRSVFFFIFFELLEVVQSLQCFLIKSFKHAFVCADHKTGENFNAAQWNGNISGMVWKSDGDDTRRKYDFVYDAANRILRADFEQQNPDNNWNNSIVNFNMKMGDGVDASSAYDANGNIKRLQQWGLKLASSGQIDDLAYNYEDKSNKLLNVMDAFDDPDTKLGDFRVSAQHPSPTKTATTADYTYDANGNLLKDLNKDITTTSNGTGITYSHLNTTDYVTIKRDATSTKGIISYIYNSNGVKIKKTVTENPHASNNNTTTITTTNYLGPFVYESRSISPADPNRPNYTDRQLYIMHEEGRIRYKPENTSFEYDYMIKDHLGNVRIIQIGLVRDYSNYLIHKHKRTDNPAVGMFIKDRIRKLLPGLLSTEAGAVIAASHDEVREIVNWAMLAQKKLNLQIIKKLLL
ncbi:MAG: hypothetical protein JNK79_05530 [Chitinophagaceae bacterium]|nr:hypothetical protein [Chitinophagaceae bacterium]